MFRIRRIWSLAVLAACIVAALVFRRFVFVAYYPVAMSLAVAAGFGLSLFGRRSLCQELAGRFMPGGLMPDGAESYCRRLTAAWCALLLFNAAIALWTVFAPRWIWVLWNCALSYGMTGAFLLAETLYRRRRFSVPFHTSGSTSSPKTVVKSFESLAREVAYHRKALAQVLEGRPLFLSTVEPQHMYGTLWTRLLPRAAGCPVDEEMVSTPEALLEKMKSAKSVFIVTTPTFIDRFAAYAALYDVPRSCVEITTSGSLLSARTAAAAKRIFGRAPLEIFGSTETGGVAVRRQDADDPASAEWKVLPPVRVSSGEDGRLVVRSPFSFRRSFTMGDAVEMSPGGRSFKLLGRRDRLVKIAGQRLHLPEMEDVVKSLPDVADAALCELDGAHEPCLGAVVVPADGNCPAGDEKRRAARALRSRLLPLFPRGAAPRRFRFVRELPRNAQGKVLAAELKRLFEGGLEIPSVSNASEDDGSWSADFVFDPSAQYFKGHFPGLPVLPGVAQLGVAHHFLEARLGRRARLSSVRKMKFTHAIVPGVEVRFTLKQAGAGEWSYEYRKGDVICSSGVMCF